MSKQVSRCCINFPRELTCQILTNQSIKIGGRTWPQHDYGEKSLKRLPSLHVKAGWSFGSEVVWNQNFKSAAHEHDLFHMQFEKNELEPAIIWIVATCQLITEPAIRSGDTDLWIHCLDSCQLIKTWMYNIRLQAPKLAWKCEIKHWYACGADGRKVGRVGVRSCECQIVYDG